MRYVIDKSRPDGFYHYTKYDDNDSSITGTFYTTNLQGEKIINKITFNVGWSLYSKQETPEEKSEWLKAVQEFNKERNVKGPAEVLHSYIQDVRDTMKIFDKQFPENKSLMLPSVASLISLAESTDKCDDEFLQKLHSLGLSQIPSIKEMFNHAWKAGRFNAKNEINKMLYSLAALGINGFITPVLDSADGMIDTVFGTIDCVYNEVKRLANRAWRIYKQICNIVNDPEERKRLLNLFLEELKRYALDIVEYIYQALCIDVYIEIFKTLRNLWNSRQEIWKSLIAKLNSLVDFDYKSLGSEIINNLAANIIAFIPLIGALMGALFSKKCADEEEQIAARKNLAYALSNGKITDPDKVDELRDNKIRFGRSSLQKASVVYSLCCNEQNDFRFTKKYKQSDNTLDSSTSEQEDSSTNDVIEINCKVSMCDYEDPTDLDYFTNDSAYFPEKLTIEFDKSFTYSITVSVGQLVKITDTIGYISGIPVKSKYDFTVTEIYNNYIIGKYYFNDLVFNPEDENLEQKAITYANDRINSFDTSEYESLQSNFTDIASAEDFILNYAPYCRISDFALNVGNYITSKKIGNYIDDYYDFVDNEKAKHANDIKKVAGKENVTNRGNNGQMYTLKKEIDSVKNVMLDRFIKMSLSSNGESPYKSKGRIADYSLYSYYLDYLYSDRFIYNEDNKFIVKLHNLISEFIAERTKIELSNENISALIVDFNDTCNKYLAPYWKFNNKSYYQSFCGLFTSDYYEMNTEKIIPKTDAKDSFTLYNRVYMYLQSLTSFTPQADQHKITIDENTDVNAIARTMSNMAEDSAYNKNDEKIKTNLRRIALKFVTIRKVEQNMTNGFVNTFVSENNIAIEKLNSGGINPIPISEYYEGEVLMMGLIPLNRSSYLGSYLTMLKKTAQAESKKLKQLVEEAINWYNEHRNDNDNIIELFKPLMQINWPIATVIYHENEKTDFYLFSPIMGVEPPPTSMKELEDIERSLAPTPQDNDPNNLKNIGAYPATADGCGIGDIKYWLKYCGIASAVHCMLPIYWSTGLIILPAPVYVLLPVIYIPFYVVRGRVTVVFGIGLCGIMPLPMVLFVNMGTLAGSIIIPINMVVDMLMQTTKQLLNMETKTVEMTLAPMISMLDNQIRQLEQEKEDIPYQISQIKALTSKKKIKDIVNITMGKDTTFKQEECDASQINFDADPVVDDEDTVEAKMEEYTITIFNASRKIFDTDPLSQYEKDMQNIRAGLIDKNYAVNNGQIIFGSAGAEGTFDGYPKAPGYYMSANTVTKILNSGIFSKEVQDMFVPIRSNTGAILIYKIPSEEAIRSELETRTISGKKFTLHKKIIGSFEKIMNNALSNSGFVLNSYYGSFVYREVRPSNIKKAYKLIDGVAYVYASNHSLGLAFDINYDINGFGYYRSDDPTKTLKPDSKMVTAFTNAQIPGVPGLNWGWGGTYKDYMHFSAINGN